MPVHKIKEGWKFGEHGHVFKTREDARKQARAIYASGYRDPKTKGSKKK